MTGSTAWWLLLDFPFRSSLAILVTIGDHFEPDALDLYDSHKFIFLEEKDSVVSVEKGKKNEFSFENVFTLSIVCMLIYRVSCFNL